MRIRTVMAVVALLLPRVATAQLPVPGIDARRPDRRVPDGRQPEAIDRAQRLVRSRYSVEVYPLISRVTAAGEGSPTASWTSFGSGTRLDWRHTDYLSWTLDVTVSYFGGAAITETAEVGARIRPKNWNDRVRPFADLRAGFEHASQDLGFPSASIRSSEMRYGRGLGAIAGAGVEYFLTNTLELATAVSAMRSYMTAYNFSGVSAPTTEPSYRMSTYRLSVGLKYTPARYLPAPGRATP
jgi:hypothetical protein